MAAVEEKDRKKELVEKTAEQFQQLNEDNKMFILGYMLGIQQERQRTTPQPQTANEPPSIYCSPHSPDQSMPRFQDFGP